MIGLIKKLEKYLYTMLSFLVKCLNLSLILMYSTILKWDNDQDLKRNWVMNLLVFSINNFFIVQLYTFTSKSFILIFKIYLNLIDFALFIFFSLKLWLLKKSMKSKFFIKRLHYIWMIYIYVDNCDSLFYLKNI